MALKISKRSVSISEESSTSDSISGKDDEKTIPFLRRLVDMLSENDEVISFYPGYSKKGQVTLGRIVVHDRLKVEADVLPRYFNHSSFASLRRQLNYFSFTRLGKGRQRGATYCNEGVVELDDILRLKRRSTTVGAARESIQNAQQTQQQQQQRAPAMPAKGEPRCVSDSSLSADEATPKARPPKKARYSTPKHSKQPKPLQQQQLPLTPSPTLISPRSSPIHHQSNTPEGVPQITLDLTVPSKKLQPQTSHQCFPQMFTVSAQSFGGSDADILAGCRALLSIRSLRPEEISSAF